MVRRRPWQGSCAVLPPLHAAQKEAGSSRGPSCHVGRAPLELFKRNLLGVEVNIQRREESPQSYHFGVPSLIRRKEACTTMRLVRMLPGIKLFLWYVLSL
jgi:hypothetical protein